MQISSWTREQRIDFWWDRGQGRTVFSCRLTGGQTALAHPHVRGGVEEGEDTHCQESTLQTQLRTQGASDRIAARWFCSQEGNVEFKAERAEMRKTEGAGRDVCRRRTGTAGSHVAVTVHRGLQRPAPTPPKLPGGTRVQPAEPVTTRGCTHGPPRLRGGDSGWI